MKDPEKTIQDYLETSYSGAKMAKDEECMVRLSRAIAAFKLDPTGDSKEYFTNRAIEESIRN